MIMASGFNVDDKIVKRPADDVPLTEWEEQEWIKCAMDKYYFFENYAYVQGEHGKMLFKPRSYQSRIIDAGEDNRFTVTISGRQSGKCQLDDTLTLTRVSVGGKLFELDLTIGELHELSKCKTPEESIILLTKIEEETNDKEKGQVQDS